MRTLDMYVSQQIWEQQEMGNTILFFKGEIMEQKTPVLMFNRRPLVPIHVERQDHILSLYYPPETPMPADQRKWQKQLAEQGYTLRSYSRSFYTVKGGFSEFVRVIAVKRS